MNTPKFIQDEEFSFDSTPLILRERDDDLGEDQSDKGISSDGDSVDCEHILTEQAQAICYEVENSKKRRKFYRLFVKKVNSFGGIRKIYLKFVDERRLILKSNLQNTVKRDEYFNCCKKNV